MLHDIGDAVEDYLNDFVTTNVTPVQPDPDSPGTINPNEFGTFKIDFFNASEPNGVPLLDVRHHLTFAAFRHRRGSDSPDVCALNVASRTTGPVPRSTSCRALSAVDGRRGPRRG